MATTVLKGSKSPVLPTFSRLSVEIGMPRIEGFFLSREIALETGLGFGNDAPTTGIFVKEDSRYLCPLTIAKDDFVRRHKHLPFSFARIFAEQPMENNYKLQRAERKSAIYRIAMFAREV